LLGVGTRVASAAPDSSGSAGAGSSTIRCDNLSNAELNVDGLLDDWPKAVIARAGAAGGSFDLRCSWDGTALAIAIDVKDDRVIRVRSGRGHEDHVEIAVGAAGVGKPMRIDAYPGNAIAKAKLIAPRGVAVADSLQPKGFSIETRIPAKAIAGLGTATAALELHVVFHDSNAATGGADTDVPLDATLELADRADLFDDLLRTTKLTRKDIKLDTLAKLDPDRAGKQRSSRCSRINSRTSRCRSITRPTCAACSCCRSARKVSKWSPRSCGKAAAAVVAIC
jgi:hypothetical protein